MHERVNGTRPDGEPYRAMDPELIGWVHTCIPWAVMTAYERYNRPLAEEKDRYLAEQAVIGRMGGAGADPGDGADLERVRRGDAPEARGQRADPQFFEFLLTRRSGRPARPAGRAINRFQVHAWMSLMPEWARRSPASTIRTGPSACSMTPICVVPPR